VRDGWHLLGAVQLANFTQLRRHIGAARSERLMIDLLGRVGDTVPRAEVSTIGRSLVEFVFDGEGAEALRQALDALEAAFSDPLTIDGEPLHMAVTLAGVATPWAIYDDVRAAEALEDALVLARSDQRVVVRSLAEQVPAFDRMALIRDFSGALGRGELFLHYQPKIHVRRQRVVSAEALIRWNHPSRGMILPGEFIEAAEELGEIGEITLWTLRKVVADQAALRAAGHDIEIFVNISGRLLADPRFVTEAGEAVAETAGRIGFEITETSVIRDPQTAIAHLRRFAEAGIPIAIDDYGAGLSSLAYLKQLPARELKIDKMFVTQLTSSNRDPLIVRSTIDLAHALEMEVTAEGVETQAALALLSVMGCDMVQGFLISRPIALEALHRFLDDGVQFAGGGRLGGSFNQPASFWKTA
jgi:EAL domain-containing protein (putative c-di-GMP-specific phosphodiesterase class I)